MASIIEIDPVGDVILVLGSGSAEKILLVSSHTMSHISSTWQKMLMTPLINFDGRIGIRRICLPGDIAEAMTAFCNIAHSRSDDVKIPNFNVFEQLSILCNNYDATQVAMCRSTIGFLKPFSPDMFRQNGEEELLPRLLHAAFAFNNIYGFALVSRELLYGSASTILSNTNSKTEEYQLFPPGFLDTIATYQQDCVERLLEAVKEALSPISIEAFEDRQAKETPNSSPITDSDGFVVVPHPCKREEILRSWTLELDRVEIWPFEHASRHLSIISIYRKLNSVRDIPAPSNWANEAPCPCDVCSSGFEKLMGDVVLQMPVKLDPLCLVCVKKGHFTPRWGNCRNHDHMAELHLDPDRKHDPESIQALKDTIRWKCGIPNLLP